MPADRDAGLTDAQIEEKAHRMAWRYKKSSDPHHSDTYTFNRSCLLTFARALLSTPPLEAVQQEPEFDRDSDGDLLIDWSPRAGRMLTLSLRADGLLYYAFTWDDERAHGQAQMPAPLAQLTPVPQEPSRLTAALRRLESAVAHHLGIGTQTKHLKGFAYSEEVRKELHAAYAEAHAALAQPAPVTQELTPGTLYVANANGVDCDLLSEREAARHLRKAMGVSQDFDDWPLATLMFKAAERLSAALAQPAGGAPSETEAHIEWLNSEQWTMDPSDAFLAGYRAAHPAGGQAKAGEPKCKRCGLPQSECDFQKNSPDPEPFV